MNNLTPNLLIHADAVDVLERLGSNTVALVYFDPPWLISKEAEKSVYVTLLSRAVQQSFRILRDDGSLVVYLPSSSLVDFRLILSQAFGNKSRYEIAVKRTSNSRSTAERIPSDHDLLLVFTKSAEHILNPQFREKKDEELSMFQHEDEQGRYALTNLVSPANSPSFQFKWRTYSAPQGRSWRYSIDKLEGLLSQGRIQLPNNSVGLPRLKQYITDEHRLSIIGNIWEDITSVLSSHEIEKDWRAFQQPIALLERIINLFSNEGDTIVDPFCGTATAIISAQCLNRKWIGVDSDRLAIDVANARIAKTFKQDKETVLYQQLSEGAILNVDANELRYREVIFDIQAVNTLKGQIGKLITAIHSVKEVVKKSTDDNNETEGIFQLITQLIDVVLINIDTTEYKSSISSWLGDWDRLSDMSKIFLPQGEFLYSILESTDSPDFSPFIAQYCRALESEILTKLFVVYTNEFHERTEPVKFLDNDLKVQTDERVKGNIILFAGKLKKKESNYTLGQMSKIMALLKVDGNTYKSSRLIQDFRRFALEYFQENILDNEYLNQIDKITKDYRNKSTHPYILNKQAADECRELVRDSLRKFILNYKKE